MADSVPTAPTGPSFPTSDISSAALAALSEPVASQPVASTPAPAALRPSTPTYATPQATPDGVVPPTVPGEQPAAPAAPTPQSIDPNAYYTVTTKVNGVESTESVTGKQLLDRQMNARAFTQNQQQLRAQQKQLLAERAGIQDIQRQNAEKEAILNDPGRLAAYIQGKFPHLTVGQAQQQAAAVQAQAGITPQVPQYAPPAPQLDPQGLASIGDVQAQVGQRVAELEAELGRRATAAETQTIQRIEERAARIAQDTVAQTIANLQTAHQVAGYDRQIDTHVEQLITEHPVLRLVPELNDLLRYRVQQMNPQSPQEMFAGFTEVAKAIAEGIDAHYQQSQTAVIAAKAKLTTNGMAIPSGVTPTTPAPASSGNFSHGGRANWKGLGAEVGAAIDVLRSR